ncbi:hypothetical protein GCM10027174_21500 [Salinifilum aidingensis]
MSAEDRVIAGRYRLVERIGSGAMGVVWQAVDERLHRTVAVKLLLLQPGYTREETEEARQRTMREGRIAARLQHQNAILVFDVAEDEGQPVLVMEYLPSQSLASVVADQGVLPPMHVTHIGVQVAGALAAAHMAGIVHRDLKPGNILLGENGQAKITDFGISRAIGDVAVTKSGILAGTPAYLAPEVATGRDPAPASDVFSLGSTLYAAVEGAPPFGTDENAISLLHRVAQGNVEPPRQAGPLAPALMQMLRADPVERPTMAQARDLLQAVVDGRPIPNATPTAGWQRPAAAAAAPAPHPTRVGGPAATKASPPTRTGAGAPASAPAAASAPSRRGLPRPVRAGLWALALIAAVLLGVLGANALGGGGGPSDSAASPSEQPAGPAATSTTAAAPTTTAASTTAPTSTSTTTTSTTTSSSPTSTTSSSEVATEDAVELVEEYYDAVPGDVDAGWSMLGPQLRSQGEDSYREFWKSIESVEVKGKPKASGKTVAVKLKFTTTDGETSTEKHRLGLVEKNGDLRINTDSVV